MTFVGLFPHGIAGGVTIKSSYYNRVLSSLVGEKLINKCLLR